MAEILSLIQRLAKESGVSILLSSHLLHQVQAVCDRVAIFVRGKVVAQGPPHELAQQQVGPIRVEFRFEGNDDAGADRLRSLPGVTDVTAGRVPGAWIAGLEHSDLGDTVRALAVPGVAVVGIRRLDDDLDTIYRRYFETHEEVTA